MGNNNKYLIPLLLSIFLSSGLLLGYYFSPSIKGTNRFSFSSPSKGEQRYQKIQDIIEILDNKYVDTINGSRLFEKTIADMLHKLDPHSNYIPADELQAMQESIQGEFGGIGVRFFMIRDTLCITHVIKDSPSEKVGILAGDKIVKVEQTNIASKKVSTEKIMSLLKGTKDTPVNVEIIRNEKRLKKNIIRGGIPIASISCSMLLDKITGYIKVNQFSVNTAKEFYKEASYLKAQGMRKLILDLRNNGGGVLTSATKIVDEFLPGGLPIVSTKGEHSKDYTYKSTNGGILEHTDVVVLINANSASASEIVAGAIQDNDRGTIIGRRSFGKGLVQEDIRLRDGSNLRLTVARYYTPTGRCIQKSYNGGYEDYYQDQVERIENGELYSPDSSMFVDSLKFTTPRGKTVYGGGGIMPDVFVPFDTTGMGFLYSALRYTSAFQAFGFDYVNDKRTKWSSPKQFNKTFNVDEALFQKFMNYIDEYYAVKANADEIASSKKMILRTIKAEIARQLWEEQGYYYVQSKFDREVQKGIQELEK